VREALFSILGPPPEGGQVLDLFAGAGTLGLEALSRGAGRAVFIDVSRQACRYIRNNARTLGLEDASEVHCGDVRRILPRLAGRFDWVFVDPPYATDLAEQTLELLGSGTQLSDVAIVVAEHDRRRQPADEYGCLVKADRRRYGDTELTFFSRAGT
jgi:16S rRNA (guanine(966)-N(2))-methyltransferase RsmD